MFRSTKKAQTFNIANLAYKDCSHVPKLPQKQSFITGHASANSPKIDTTISFAILEMETKQRDTGAPSVQQNLLVKGINYPYQTPEMQICFVPIFFCHFFLETSLYQVVGIPTTVVV